MNDALNLDAFVHWPGAPLTDSLVRNALSALPFAIHVSSDPPISSDRPLIQWSTYDHLDHELTFKHRDTVIASSYTFRKALIRKHFLSRVARSYLAKHPASVLKVALPRTFECEIAFADELDEMWTDELWELGNELEQPETWWILKPFVCF